MGKINILDKFTAEKIAAGEVVQRPASVIKELVENSIDAGATTVTVEIKNGGTSYMRVTDNGSGMEHEDAPKAFLRHATSKIKTDTDLENIRTLGFRGEALCSVAAVSRTEMLTKQRSASEGTHIIVEGGEEIVFEKAGSPDGTTIVVKNLFFNTPARMKFMKKDSAEAAAITDIINKQALGHPDVSIRLIRDGKEVLFTPGNNKLTDTVRAVFGKDIANAVTEVNYEKSGVKVTGVTGKNNLSRPNRLMQIFFVNSRFVLNKTLSVALSEAYKNELILGRFPAAILNIEIDPSLVDANVHPEKTEVKFAQEQDVYEAVYWGVKNALTGASAPREVISPVNKNAFKMPITPTSPKQITVEEFKKLAPEKKASSFKPFVPEKPVPTPPTKLEISEEVKPYGGKLPVREIEGIENFTPKKDTSEKLFDDVKKPLFEKIPKEEKPIEKLTEKSAEKPAEEPLPPENTTDTSFVNARVIGQLFSTYILAEGDGEFFLMDQHAAHERIRYEEIRSSGYKTDTQLLLMPITVNLTPTEKALALEKSDFLLSLGFETEDFGTNTIMLRSLPADCIYEEGEDLFIELLGVLSGNESGEITAIRDKAIYTVACHSAIRANQALTLPELEKLYHEAASLEGITTCPHGRPITVKLTKYQIEKMFGRIV